MNKFYDAHQKSVKRTKAKKVYWEPELPKFSSDEIEYLVEYEKVFKPIAITCKILQDNKKLYWGYHAPVVRSLITNISNIPELKFCDPLKNAIHQSILKRFEGYDSDENLVATLVHPKFKRDYIKEKFPEVEIERLENIVLESLKDHESTPSFDLSEESNDLDEFLDVSAQSSNGVQSQDGKVLLENYFHESSQEVSLLLQNKYEPLKKLFIKTNTKILSSASCERIFSMAKHIFTASRSSLSDDKFEKLVILKSSMAK